MPRLMNVKRWQRGPHDRLYITSPEGIDLGWYDLRTLLCTMQADMLARTITPQWLCRTHR